MKRRSSVYRFGAALAAALLAAAPVALGQTWEILLPDPLYPEGGTSGAFYGGRSLAFQPGAEPGDPQRVYVGLVNYDTALPTITRLTPDAPEFPLDPAPEGVDGQALGGLAFVAEMLEIEGRGYWAVGRAGPKWKVRSSLTGDFATWETMDDWLPAPKSRSSSEAIPSGIAASATHVFVSGCANDGSGWRWVVRRKKLGSPEGFSPVLSVAMDSSPYRTRVCFFPGNGTFPAAVLTSGKTPLLGKGNSASSRWAIRRSLDGGSTFTEEHSWIPATPNCDATPVDIAYDPSTKNIYAVGVLGWREVFPKHGWVVRVNRHGGDPSKWETLIETTSQPGRAQRLAFGNGRVFISGLFLPSSTESYGVGAVISNTPGQPWTSSFVTPTFPFGEHSTSAACVIAYGLDGNLYATGEVFDFEGVTSYPGGTWMALARLPVGP